MHKTKYAILLEVVIAMTNISTNPHPIYLRDHFSGRNIIRNPGLNFIWQHLVYLILFTVFLIVSQVLHMYNMLLLSYFDVEEQLMMESIVCGFKTLGYRSWIKCMHGEACNGDNKGVILPSYMHKDNKKKKNITNFWDDCINSYHWSSHFKGYLLLIHS